MAVTPPEIDYGQIVKTYEFPVSEEARKYSPSKFVNARREAIYGNPVHTAICTSWEGIVSEFTLLGHPKAKTCYAWAYQEGEKMRALAVLELPPVDSPESAVKVAIAAEGRIGRDSQEEPR